MSSNINTIVVGAGRIGANIAKKLQKENMNVLLIDKNKDKLTKVDDFSGFVEAGDATDLSFLEENGIKNVSRAVLLPTTTIRIFFFPISARNVTT